MATPPGTDTIATGNGCASWLVTVRPAMMPTAEPTTASLSLAGPEEIRRRVVADPRHVDVIVESSNTDISKTSASAVEVGIR
jgi:hypothetical protein